jgi:hypothetical protein
MSRKNISYATPFGYNIYPNPAYLNSRPSDKHCSNCRWWSKLNQWCNESDGPQSSSDADRGYCKKWEWVVPRYLYPGMEGYKKAEKEAGK